MTREQVLKGQEIIKKIKPKGKMPYYIGNDQNPNYDSLYLLEPNLLASYYCIKSLEILNKLDEMDIGNFHAYLSELYNNTGDDYFYISYFYPEILNLVATTIGIELSEITGFSSINRENSLNFVFTI